MESQLRECEPGLSDGHKANFEALKRAAVAGDLALMQCREVTTGKLRAVVCAVTLLGDGTYIFAPFGHLTDGNPFKEYAPPEAE